MPRDSAVLYGAGRIALPRLWDADPGASIRL